MTDDGPLLQELTHRLSECPAAFLEEPRLGKRGRIHVDAIVFDLMLDLGHEELGRKDLSRFRSRAKKERNRLRLVLVAAWLLWGEWFHEHLALPARALEWLRDGLGELAKLVSADLFVKDPDRREELARLCLAALDLKPGGETDAESEDRLRSLSSVERREVIEKTREREERARKLREAMKRKEAEEAAARATGEW